jgi:hypothetical protein
MNDEKQWPSWMRHPVVGVMELVIGLIGIMLAVLFYLGSRVERKPYYHIEPTRNVIVNRELAVGQQLTVLLGGQSLSANNVTAMQCHFWNGGRATIRPENVLQPIKLVLGNGAEILEVAAIRQTRPEVVKFRVSSDQGPEGKRTNSATVTFSILERNDGATLQVVYVGGPGVSASFQGTVEGAELQQVQSPLEATGQGPRKGGDRNRFLQFLIITYAFFPILFLPLSRWWRAWEPPGDLPPVRIIFEALTNRRLWIVQFVALVLMTCVYYYFFLSYPDIPSALLH